jgi:hypothetical protein
MAGATQMEVAKTVEISWHTSCSDCTFNLFRGAWGKAACVGVKHPIPFVYGIAGTHFTDYTAVDGHGPYSYNVQAVAVDGKVSGCAPEDVMCELGAKHCAIK